MKRATLRDIATATGYSANTVSRALNDRREIRQETKRKIVEAADRLGYHPNRMARGLRQQRSGILGVVVTDISNPFFGAVVKSIEQAATALGYGIILQDTDERYELEWEAVQLLLSQHVDGVIITPVQTRKDSILELERQRIPFLLLGRRFADFDCSYVIPNDEQAGFLAAEHLIQYGHRTIGLVNAPAHISSAIERERGFVKAHRKHRVAVHEPLLRDGALSAEDGYRLTRDIFAKPERPTALVAFSDFVALGMMRAVQDAGLEIPEDVSVVGIDDIQFSRCCPQALTTVRSPKEELGQRAVALINQLLEQSMREEEQEIAREELDVELIVRETTARVRVGARRR